MNPADLLVAAIIILVVSIAVITLVNEKRSGRGCCGCKNCGRQAQIIEIEDDTAEE